QAVIQGPALALPGLQAILRALQLRRQPFHPALDLHRAALERLTLRAGRLALLRQELLGTQDPRKLLRSTLLSQAGCQVRFFHLGLSYGRLGSGRLRLSHLDPGSREPRRGLLRSAPNFPQVIAGLRDRTVLSEKPLARLRRAPSGHHAAGVDDVPFARHEVVRWVETMQL